MRRFATEAEPKHEISPPATTVRTVPNKPISTRDEKRRPIVPNNCRFVYPEFLPDPKVEWRNHVREKLERLDMLDRRTQIDIPEFYVGCIMAVTSSDPHAAGKVSRFVGLCSGFTSL